MIEFLLLLARVNGLQVVLCNASFKVSYVFLVCPV